MATHSSVLAWRIPGTGEPGGLPSMRPHRVGQYWSDLAAAAAADSILKRRDGDYCHEIKRHLLLGRKVMTNIDSILRWPLYLLLRAGILQKKWSSHCDQQKSPKCSTWMQSQKQQNDLCSFPRQSNYIPQHLLKLKNERGLLAEKMVSYLSRWRTTCRNLVSMYCYSHTLNYRVS